MNRLDFLKKKHRGRQQREQLKQAFLEIGIFENISFMDFEDSYNLFDKGIKVSAVAKKMRLKDCTKKNLLDSMSFFSSNLPNSVVIFLTNNLDAGGIKISKSFLFQYYLVLIEEIDGDSLYAFSSDAKHGIYIDKSSNNVTPDRCYELENWSAIP